MKYTLAWANIAAENVCLKVSLIAVGICMIFLAYATVSLALKAPLVVERGCYSKVLAAKSAEPTRAEMDSFIRKVLEQRFNSSVVPIEGYLSVDELKNRMKEQGRLLAKGISQFLIVRNIEFKDSHSIVKADRLYSVGDVRSSMAFRLKLKLETKSRTATNPYGLILVETEELAKQGGKHEKK